VSFVVLLFLLLLITDNFLVQAMNSDMEKYENVARWLDGEPVELTGDERALLADFHRDEVALGDRLSVELPEASGEQLRASLARGLASRRSRLRIFAAPAVRWVALAAAVLVVSTLLVYRIAEPGYTPSSGDASQLAWAEDIDFLDALFADEASPGQADTDEELANFIKPMFTAEAAWAILAPDESETPQPGTNG